MQYGFIVTYGDARSAADLAAEAERNGWDGLFVWEPVWGIDAWVALTAAAMRTERIRLGTMLTPLPRRRPWDLAGQTATLDNLSGGRVILSVGLGAVHEGWLAFETDPGRKTRAELLDEGLEVLIGLWRGQPFDNDGTHYRVRATGFLEPPPPVQRPRIPIWVVGAWPRRKSMRRAARWDGWLPNYLPPEGGSAELTPEVFAEAAAWLCEQRSAEGLPLDGYDLVMEGTTPGDDPAAAAGVVRRWADAGATWWLESDWSQILIDPETPRPTPIPADEIRETARTRLRAGPPRID